MGGQKTSYRTRIRGLNFLPAPAKTCTVRHLELVHVQHQEHCFSAHHEFEVALISHSPDLHEIGGLELLAQTFARSSTRHTESSGNPRQTRERRRASRSHEGRSRRFSYGGGPRLRKRNALASVVKTVGLSC